LFIEIWSELFGQVNDLIINHNYRLVEYDGHDYHYIDINI